MDEHCGWHYALKLPLLNSVHCRCESCIIQHAHSFYVHDKNYDNSKILWLQFVSDWTTLFITFSRMNIPAHLFASSNHACIQRQRLTPLHIVRWQQELRLRQQQQNPWWPIRRNQNGRHRDIWMLYCRSSNLASFFSGFQSDRTTREILSTTNNWVKFLIKNGKTSHFGTRHESFGPHWFSGPMYPS